MGKKSFSRTEAERSEGLETVKNDVPSNRMQGEQQVQNTDDALNTKVSDPGFALNKQKAKGSKIKQEAIAEVISGGSDSGMGIGAGGRGVSGTNGGILGAGNSTPIAEKSRSNTRPGKKLDRLATKLNNTPCEQTLLDFDESKPLADSANDDQGFNGTYRNEYARSQKHAGAVPADLMFQRSVDLILNDKLYFGQGQIVLPSSLDAAKLAYTPTKTYVSNDTMRDYKVFVGDFLPRKLHVELDESGKVKWLYFDVDDITAVETDPDMMNKSSAARLIHMNRSELDRISMDAKAGDEKADIWTPLARAVFQPSRTAYLLSAIEAMVGNYIYLAYAKATTNFSYQLNRAAKDGQDIVGPAVEELMGSLYEFSDSADYVNADTYGRGLVANCFNKVDYRNGSPALMIEAYDSTAKYNNKADLLLQPRGFRMHLQTADNNINVFKVDKTFIDVFAGQECFSTIDHEYDPLLPICMTDKAALIDRLNINQLGAFAVNHFVTTYTGENIEANGGESDSIAEVVTLVPATLNSGGLWIHQKITNDGNDDHDGEGIVKVSGGLFGWKKDGYNRTDETVEIIISPYAAPTGYAAVDYVSAGTAITFNALKTRAGGVNHDRITSSSFEYIYDSRLYMKDAGPYTYCYSDLRNNYVVTVKHPIIEGLVEYFENAIGAKMYKLLNHGENIEVNGYELSVPWVFSTQYATLASYLLLAATPWIQQVRQNSMKDVLYYEENVHEYPFSGLVNIKDAPFENYVNFTYSGYDEPLSTKIMQPTVAINWIMPSFFWHIDDTYEDYLAPWYFNENDYRLSGLAIDKQEANMSMPSIRSGIRLSSLDTFYGMSEKDIRLSLDRITSSLLVNAKVSARAVYKYGVTTDGQVLIRFGNGNDPFTIGDLLSAPRELGLVADVPGYVLTPNGVSGRAASSANGMGTAFRIKVWTSKSVTTSDSSILDTNQVDINRAANFVQKWFQLDANTGTSNEEILGLVFGINDEGAAQFTPFIENDLTPFTNAPTIVSHQRSMWTRLQTLPFIISPFDAEATTYSTVIDIYDIAYMFGLAGFRASDYRESVYNRSKEVVNQGMLFVEDPWIIDSPIVKHGASSTGVKVTKGYELAINK